MLRRGEEVAKKCLIGCKMGLKIYTTGDSHCMAGWSRLNMPNVAVTIKHLGPRLMYTFGKEKWILLKDNFAHDAVVFCFGEIDTRCHLHKFPDYKEMTQNLVKEYMTAVSLNVRRFPNLKTCIYFIPPAIHVADFLHLYDPVFDEQGIWQRGSDEVRKTYVEYMNETLKKKCKENGFIFVDLYSHYCDKDGYLDKNKSYRRVHIGDTKPLIDFIKSNLINGDGRL